MDAPERGALMLVRVIAGALFAWTLVELALYWAVCEHNHTPLKISVCVLKSLPLLVGIVGLIKSKSLARWISELFD